MFSQSAFPLINTCAFQPQFSGTSTAVETVSAAAASAFNSARTTAESVLRLPLQPHLLSSPGSATKCATAAAAMSSTSAAVNCAPQSLRRKTSALHLQSENSMAANSQTVYDVFLGGSCGKTVWRQDLVIPYLKKRGITYYDPQRPTWSEHMIYEEALAKEHSRLFLFVLDPGNINATSFLEIAYLAARKAPRLVVVFLGRREWSDKAHPMDLPDRIRTCNLLEAILKRHSVPMLTSITSALDCVDEMIIGEQSWRCAIANPLQRIPFLQVKSAHFARTSCRLYKRALARFRNRFCVYVRRVCVILTIEMIFAAILILFVFKSTVPVWAIIAPIIAFDYISLIIVFFYCRFKSRQSKEKIGAKIIISGTPIPRMTESATLLKPSNSTTISSLQSGNGIYQTKIWKQTSTESQQLPYSTSLPEDIVTKSDNNPQNDEALSNGERFPRRRSSAKSKIKDNGEENTNTSDDASVDSSCASLKSVLDGSSTFTTKKFAHRLVDSAAFVDSEVRCDSHQFNGCGRRVLHQCSVFIAQDNMSALTHAAASVLSHGQRCQRRETIATASSSSKDEEASVSDVSRTISICKDASHWAECGKCLRCERLTMSSIASAIGYDVFLSCSSSCELDWITQKAVPQLHKSGLSYTSALMYDKEMRIPMLHTASHILYYIPSYKTFLSGMIEIAYFIGHWDWQVTVCVPREAECLIPIEAAAAVTENRDITQQEQRALCAAVERRNECYRMAFLYLKDMAQRRQCRVFTKVEDAIKHIASDKNRCGGAKQRYGGARLRQIVEKQHLVKTGPIDVEQSRLSLDDSGSLNSSIDLS